MDGTAILHVASGQTLCQKTDFTADYDIGEISPMKSDHDYADVPNVMFISDYQEEVISYIAGYVVRAIGKKITCQRCLAALSGDNNSRLVARMDRGGLIYASADVIVVCRCVELCVQRLMKTLNGNLPPAAGITSAINTEVLSASLQKEVFNNLNEHMFDTSVVDNHLFILIKLITTNYINVLMHHLAKQHNDNLTGERIRKNYTKIILFKHQ